MKKSRLLFSCFCFCLQGFAQNAVEIYKGNVSSTSRLTFTNSNTENRIQEQSHDLSLPFKLNEKSTFLTGVLYEKFNTKLFQDGKAVNFSSVTLKLGMNLQLHPRLSMTTVLLPKLAKDISAVDVQDFQLGAITIFKFKKTTNLHFKYGLYFNTELFGPFFVPLAGLYFLSPNKKLEANLLLPLQADVNYRLHKALVLGANFNGQIRTYHFSNLLPGHTDTYLARATNEIYAYVRYDVNANLSIYARGGISVGRSYRVYDSEDKVTFGLPATFIGPARSQLNSDFSNGALAMISLLYRIFPKN
jgi:hypothetical protein